MLSGAMIFSVSESIPGFIYSLGGCVKILAYFFLLCGHEEQALVIVQTQ